MTVQLVKKIFNSKKGLTSHMRFCLNSKVAGDHEIIQNSMLSTGSDEKKSLAQKAEELLKY